MNASAANVFWGTDECLVLPWLHVGRQSKTWRPARLAQCRLLSREATSFSVLESISVKIFDRESCDMSEFKQASQGHQRNRPDCFVHVGHEALKLPSSVPKGLKDILPTCATGCLPEALGTPRIFVASDMSISIGLKRCTACEQQACSPFLYIVHFCSV